MTSHTARSTTSEQGTGQLQTSAEGLQMPARHPSCNSLVERQIKIVCCLEAWRLFSEMSPTLDKCHYKKKWHLPGNPSNNFRARWTWEGACALCPVKRRRGEAACCEVTKAMRATLLVGLPSSGSSKGVGGGMGGQADGSDGNRDGNDEEMGTTTWRILVYQ